MCENIKTIAKGKNGKLTMCRNCNHYHLTFNNIFFEFNEKEFKQFRKFIFHLETNYWNENYPYPKVERNIPIPSLQKNLILLFNQQEIDELKTLLSTKIYQKYQRLKAREIDYGLILN